MYCTPDDIKGRVPEDTLQRVSNAADIDKAIEAAESIIDACLSGRYTVPFKTVPKIIKETCIDLSVYKLYESVMELEDNAGMRKRYDNAMKLLQKIMDGEIKLGIVEENNDSGFFAASMVAGGGAQFTMSSMRSL